MIFSLKSLLIFCLLFFGLPLLAQTEQVASYDLNQDKILDRFEYRVDGKLVRVEEDRNGDRKIDYKTIFNDKSFIKIEIQDTNADEKFDRKVSLKIYDEKKYQVLTELDKNADGVFEIKYQSLIDRDQKQDVGIPICEQVVDDKIMDLTNTSLKAVAESDSGFLPTGVGYKIDKACYNNWGPDFGQVVKDTALGGLQCLRKLDKDNRKDGQVSGALRNAFGLSQLMKDDKISLMCSEEEYAWTGIAGHASTDDSDVIKEKDVHHPFVSINKNYPKNSSSSSERPKELKELKNTIFHETLHNLGYKHYEGMEFPYTCGECCFPEDNPTAGKTDIACKLCAGNYTNEMDINYVKDFLTFSQLNYQEADGAKLVLKYVKENPQDNSAFSMLAYANSGVYSPVGGALGSLIESKNLNLSEEDKKYITDSQRYKNGSMKHEDAAVSSQALATTIYELYYNHDKQAALAHLEKNKEAILKEMEKLKKDKKGYGHHYYEANKKILDDLLYDMWINGYPDDLVTAPFARRAYELDQFLSGKKPEKSKPGKKQSVSF